MSSSEMVNEHRMAHLLSAYLFDTYSLYSCHFDDDIWNELFRLAQWHGVTALMFEAVVKLPQVYRPSRKLLFHLSSVVDGIEKNNAHRHTMLQQLSALVCSQLGKPLVVVKGSSLARLYKEPLHRECGDNDVLTGDMTEAVCHLVEQQGVTVCRDNPRHYTFKLDGVLFECHNYLLYNHDDPQWQSVPYVSTNGDDSVPLRCLPLHQEAFFLAKHMEYSTTFFDSPIKIRSLIDWVLLMHEERFSSNFCKLKSNTDVDIFADLLATYCIELFQLPQGYLNGYKSHKTVSTDDFERMYVIRHKRHRVALFRVMRRSWKYLRFSRQYRYIYGCSMFRRFYLHNVWVAMLQKLHIR